MQLLNSIFFILTENAIQLLMPLCEKTFDTPQLS